MQTISSARGIISEMLSDSGSPVRRILTLLIAFAVVAFACHFIYNTQTYSYVILPRPFGRSSSTVNQVFSPDAVNTSQPDTKELSLDGILKKAAMEDKTVILAPLNEAWASPGSIIDIFIESFRIGNNTSWLLNHLIIVALDQKAYTRCLAVHTYCFALVTEGVDFSGSEAYFMTSDYLKMVLRKIDFLRSVLEMGYSFIFSDGDIMWFRNPFPQFYLDADFQVACDHFTGNSTNLNNGPNTGFMYVKSNNRTIEFYKFWYSSREKYPRKHDQDVLNKIKHDPYIKNIGLKIRFLDTAYFGGFCEPSRDLNRVCTMHANCCFGLDSKLHDLRVMLDDWKKFLSSPASVNGSKMSWSVPQNCSIKSFHPPSKKNNTQPSKNNTQLSTQAERSKI
ncbi:PREDICTED: uncharacterized protein At4g15970-like [Nelumbo nucifera]|uniref:Uncharacterized protein At4g15970-like n=1 Tax=Nelumbo nucifera TaxID=4432 RepID=A0A1U8Q7M6_NELNU|nr:PREDICTED: uncharacterized protein At4g15970-like [Nelumbo nucifera]